MGENNGSVIEPVTGAAQSLATHVLRQRLDGRRKCHDVIYNIYGNP
jgi:hypothetical protein